MDPRALARMRQLIDGAVAAFVSVEGHHGPWYETEAAGKFTAFLEKEFGEYSNGPIHDSFFSIFRVCLDLNLNEPGTGGLKPGYAERAKEIADGVHAFWSSVPRTYMYRFPLVSLTKTPATVLSVACGSGITLDIDGDPGANKLGALTRLLEGPILGPSLAIETSGYSLFGGEDDVCSQLAISACKVTVALGEVLGIFASEYQFGKEQPTKASQREATATRATSMSMPHDFGRALSRVVFARRALQTPGTILTPAHERSAAELHEYVGRYLTKVGTIIGKARVHLTKKVPANETGEQRRARVDSEHCARIATAAEWMFDANSGAVSAMSYVQLAIAFEALYGGTKDDPVVETLSNRLVYGLASSEVERDTLAQRFHVFYGKRSRIVHSGASRLMPDETELFRWGMDTLRRALAHEIGLAA